MSLAAKMNNKSISKERVAVFEKCFAMCASWRNPTATERQYFREIEHEINRELLALAKQDGKVWYVYSALHFGFPDPAEFLFLSRSMGGSPMTEKPISIKLFSVGIDGAGYFEEWPECWGQDPTPTFTQAGSK